MQIQYIKFRGFWTFAVVYKIVIPVWVYNVEYGCCVITSCLSILCLAHTYAFWFCKNGQGPYLFASMKIYTKVIWDYFWVLERFQFYCFFIWLSFSLCHFFNNSNSTVAAAATIIWYLSLIHRDILFILGNFNCKTL